MPLAVFTGGADAAQYRRYKGSGSLNEIANWTAAVGLGVARYPKLAGGPGGLFLLASAANNSVLRTQVERDRPSGRRSPWPQASGPPSLHVFQDAGGRLHAVFSRGDADGLYLVHAVSMTARSGGAASWRRRAHRPVSPTRASRRRPITSVWRSSTGGSTGEIRVFAVGPDAPTTVSQGSQRARLDALEKKGQCASIELG